MDPAQLASEACSRLAALQASGSTITSDVREHASEPLLATFTQLGKLDGWAKIALDRLAVDPRDSRAADELRTCLEQAARLHPQFTRRLADVVDDRSSVPPSFAHGPSPHSVPSTVSIPQPAASR